MHWTLYSVSVLIRRSGTDPVSSKWKAINWNAAAHEDTVCDASQISRASTLRAQDHGATVWISAGKHASFLNEELCRRGCGGDVCEKMAPLPAGRIVNLGEIGMPMNGALWISSSRWPLTAKMIRTDFQPPALTRLESLPESDIAWVNPAKRPVQSTIAASDSTRVPPSWSATRIRIRQSRTREMQRDTPWIRPTAM